MTILFEDKDLLVIHKPAGLSTESGAALHPSAETEAFEYLKAQKPTGHKTYLRAVHRLDRASSGVLVLAKNKATLSALMLQFEGRETEKTYQAIVSPAEIPDEGRLIHWIARTPDRKRALVYEHPAPDAQEARMQYKVVERLTIGARLEIRLETGRFHQIRAQLAHIGYPIIGDNWYGVAAWEENKMMLHAGELRFRHPR